MLAKERQEKIKELITSNKNMKMSELSRLLGVSEMTIHRDVKTLVGQGVVLKTFGGITTTERNSGRELESADECVYCHRPLQDRISYRLILTNNRLESACCCHCGLLRQEQLGDEVLQALCFDFLTHTTISALSAWFVMETSIDLRCCQPQALPFGNRDHAERFVAGFGGAVLSMREATERVSLRMKLSSGSCCTNE